ncbi:DNA repair protein RecO [Epibacterium sp. SM1969]|uniref:DNA repair protein RecO n=1 Tax=Tritonibacter aquimaris TaxID=2663379 RepID=A0A844AUU4_9RHOB|nr:DNA repair protein RecO [Tritonibacter aquimaris]MQY42184.1 DNA repair protein RecO [Tritonibacter aquimaris]
MEWRDQGILLSTRRHGESAAIIDVFTRDHGRHAGVVRGGAGRKLGPILQPGAQLDLAWRARLENHLGSYTVEPLRSRTVAAISDRLALSGLNAVTALLTFCLADREPQPELYENTEFLLDLLDKPEIWALAYVKWELQLLEVTGFGLDLERCAVTGMMQDLIYISPKTGRAVSRDGAGEWADRLLPLSPVLRGVGRGDHAEISDALQTTGHFLTHHLAPSLGNQALPIQRARFLEAFNRPR